MASFFSANQFEKEFTPTRLCNWQVPKWHPSRPVQRAKSTKIIANDRGHILPGVERPANSPWGNFKSTWQLPDKVTRKTAIELSSPPRGGSRWAIPRLQKFKNKDKKAHDDPEESDVDKVNYTPGDFTEPHDQHPSREILLKQKAQKKRGKLSQYELNDLYIEKHECKDPIALIAEQDQKDRDVVEHVLGDDIDPLDMTREVTEKPGERNTTPIVPAYCNFQMARKMAVENLEHQPLPDSIMDRAYRKLQSQGYPNPEMALDVKPVVTGVGVRTYKAGPTHCTKLKVYRPKTCGVVPKPIDRARLGHRPHTSGGGEKEKMGAMDLAIRWDYRPADPRDEPKPPTHIDGSNGSAAPAVFTLVKTPRTPSPKNTGRSGGVFSNTFGEGDFFDKDIMRQSRYFGSKEDLPRLCTCGTSAASWNLDHEKPYQTRNKSIQHLDQNLNNRRCKSTPNLSQIAQPSDCTSIKENLGCSHHHQHNHHHQSKNKNQNELKMKNHKCQRNKQVKPTRLCQIMVPQVYPNRQKSEYKQAFKAGIPNSNSSGTCTSFDSGCGSTVCSSNNSSYKTIIKIPKPRHPYAKKDYDIDTLAPPFACWRGGAGQGGYPEHWRLASVYQHAYKPVEQRKRPLLATVYQ